MIEHVGELKTLAVHAKCEKCEYGYLEKDRSELLLGIMFKPEEGIKHVCNKCGNVEYLDRAYPYKKVVLVEDPRVQSKEELEDELVIDTKPF